MTRDAEGLPDNLSPVNTLSTSWVDENGIHIAFFDREKLPRTFLTQEDLMEALDDAEFIVTMGGASAILLIEGLADSLGMLLRAHHPLNFQLGAPAPFPPDARHRIYARMHNISPDLPAQDLEVDSVFAQVDNILKSVKQEGEE